MEHGRAKRHRRARHPGQLARKCSELGHGRAIVPFFVPDLVDRLTGSRGSTSGIACLVTRIGSPASRR